MVPTRSGLSGDDLARPVWWSCYECVYFECVKAGQDLETATCLVQGHLWMVDPNLILSTRSINMGRQHAISTLQKQSTDIIIRNVSASS
jgi:hypothetical protein